MRLAIACTVIGIGLAGCAVEPGDPQVKINYGDGPMPPFTELNYAVDFGRRCSPPDAQGRHYSSFVWLRANHSDGSYDALRAAPEYCGATATVQAD